MTVANPGPGGYRPSLKSQDLGVSEEVDFRASIHGTHKRGGITIDASTVTADSNGDKIIGKGAVLGLVDSSGKYRVYSNALAADAGGTAAGFLVHSVNLRDGDVPADLLVGGSVIAARCSGLDVSARADLAHVIFQ